MPQEPCAREVYVCSSVDTDLFQNLVSLLKDNAFTVVPITLLTEIQYRQAAKKKGLQKLLLRLATYCVYPCILLWASIKASRYSVFIVTSNTFYAPFLIALFSKIKGFRTVNLVYDLFPDALEITSTIKTEGIGSQFLGLFTSWTQRTCHLSVFLGSFLRTHSQKRWGVARKSEVIHLGADISLFKYEPKRYEQGEQLWFHYGGQLGYMHDPESLINSLSNLKNLKENGQVNVNFYVSGGYAPKVKSSLIPLGFDIHDAIPSPEWREKIKSFHIGLVSLSPGGATVCLPSKTYSMMAGGLAIIAICPVWSDLAQLILENDAGWVINNSPFDCIAELTEGYYLPNVRATRQREEIVNDFVSLVATIRNDCELLHSKRLNAQRAIRSCYNRQILGRQWGLSLRGSFCSQTESVIASA